MFQENVLCTSYYEHCKRCCFGNQVWPQPQWALGNRNHQARADQHTEFQRRPQLSGPALSMSAILSAKEEGIASVAQEQSQVSNEIYDKFQLDVLYLCISRCMMSLLKWIWKQQTVRVLYCSTTKTTEL